MIPIIYDSAETVFDRNGLGRLRDCIDCRVDEGRNEVYECDFSYPVDGANFDLIKCGRIIAVTHDDSGDVQPFDIVSYSKPIDGIVDFHAVHISYRQSGIVAQGSNISSITDAFAMLTNSVEPENPFTYETDIESTAYMASADGVPRSVRQFLGGIEGSILDAYGGEYEFNRFRVILHENRGVDRDFAIRYGVNLLDYKDDTDYSETYTSCIPYWKGNDNGAEVLVIGDRVDMAGASYNGRNVCAALDLSDKFQDKPTKAQLQTLASTLMNTRQANLPKTSISVDFVRLQDMGYEGLDSLLQCNLCDTIKVEFPRYGMSGRFKIVKTVWNVLEDKYDSMELGALSTSLADALGISNSLGGSSAGGQTDIVDYVIEEGGNGNPNTWNYRKWQSGLLECWARHYVSSMNISTTTGQLKYAAVSIANPNYPVAFVGNYPTLTITGQVSGGNGWVVGNNTDYSLTSMGSVYVYSSASRTGVGVAVDVMAVGRWK